MWFFYFLGFALVIGFYNGMVDAEDVNIREKRRLSYADSMRNLMANSRASVARQKFTWSATQETVPSDVNSEENVVDAEDVYDRTKRRVSYADSMRNLMANSRASVARQKFTWSATQENPSDVNPEEVVNEEDVNIREKRRLSYADSMRNLMANSRASVARQKFTWSATQETVPSDVNSEEYVPGGEDSEDNN